MFFVFHILVFAYLTCFEINCFSRGAIEDKNYDGARGQIPNLKEIINTASKIKRRYPELKSNLYDKILTDEMLSVKDHRGQEDHSVSPLLQISTKALMTPTLEVKQKWPMFKNIHSALKTIKKTRVENTHEVVIDYSTQKDQDVPETKFEEQIIGRRNFGNNKVVGMRSLPMKLAINGRSSSVGRLCTCMKTNPSTTCSHSCTGSSHKKRCTHSTPRLTATNLTCTHTSPPLLNPTPIPDYVYPQPMPFYMPYNSYFSTAFAGFPYTITFPHPYVLNDLKIPQTPKNHKKTTRVDDDLYYDDDDNRYKIVYDDDNSEEYSDRQKPKKTKRPKTNKEPCIHLNVEYEEDVKGDKKKSNKNAAIYDVSQDQLIKEIIKDLKKHEKDVIKYCNCHSSPRIFKFDLSVVLFVLLFKFAM